MVISMSFLLDIVVNPCETLDILKIAYFIRNILDLAFIIIPIILVVVLSFDLVKSVIAGDEGAQRKNLNIFIKRIIFTAVVFLVPTIVRFTMDFIEDGLGVNMKGYLMCINATSGDVADLVNSEKAKCTSQGGEWNDKTEMCNSKNVASDTAKKLVEELKEINSSSSKYNSSVSLSYSASGSGQPSEKAYPAAEAALMMALPSRDAARGNNGTELYQYIFRTVLGRENFRSCSEGVSSAVRWAGIDDNFPPGGPGEQLGYLRNHPDKWASVSWHGDYSKLQPGDVFLDDQHTFMYVGSELLHKYFPDAPASYNVVQASHNPNQALAESLCVIYRDDMANPRWSAFRPIRREANSKYVGIKYSKK